MMNKDWKGLNISTDNIFLEINRNYQSDKSNTIAEEIKKTY